MDAPTCLPFASFAAVRAPRPVPEAFARLWTTGSLQALQRPTVAIVGTRAPSGYGKSVARRFAQELAAAGCCIVSGLALGIDAAAHQGALDQGAPTVGILGGGHARFFPPANRRLALRMLELGGAVLSPYPPDRPARPWQFLERNGIVAALADAVVVIEAPARSGALNTAGWAAGRIPVFAVPGDVDRAHVAGCHALIRDGATLARSVRDVLDDLGLDAVQTAPEDPRSERREIGDPLQTQIVACLIAGERTLDELLSQCAVAPSRMLAALSMLELSGRLEVRPGQRYALRAT